MSVNNKNNSILVHKQNGRTVKVRNYFGLTIRCKGENNIIEIFEPIEFKRRLLCNRSKIKIKGNNNHIIFNSTDKWIANLKILEVGSNNKIVIGKNLFQSGSCKVDFCKLNNLNFKIGEDCMFGQNVEFMLGDWHSIYDINTNERLNVSKFGINIGNHVWLARNTTILKDVKIGNNNIVAYGSIVTKNFETENCVIAGSPAKVRKYNVGWDSKIIKN
mgnify:CR=1 FL=1